MTLAGALYDYVSGLVPESSAGKWPDTTFVNPDASAARDLVLLALAAAAIAAATIFVQQCVLWPLARSAVTTAACAVTRIKDAPTPVQAPAGVRRRHAAGQSDAPPAPGRRTDAEKVHAKRVKFVVAATKAISYLALLATAVVGLRGQEHWLFDPFQQHVPFAAAVPLGVRVLYLAESAYYVYTLFSMFWEPRMKDRPQMVAHHAFTLFLLLTSWYYNAVKYGTAIVLLHDVSDPLMEIAKLFNYAGVAVGSHIFFGLFALSFFYLRVWIFPTQIIRATAVNNNHYPFYAGTFISLVGLWVLHVYWSYLICCVFYRNVVLGETAGDVREED